MERDRNRIRHTFQQTEIGVDFHLYIRLPHDFLHPIDGGKIMEDKLLFDVVNSWKLRVESGKWLRVAIFTFHFQLSTFNCFIEFLQHVDQVIGESFHRSHRSKEDGEQRRLIQIVIRDVNLVVFWNIFYQIGDHLRRSSRNISMVQDRQNIPEIEHRPPVHITNILLQS